MSVVPRLETSRRANGDAARLPRSPPFWFRPRRHSGCLTWKRPHCRQSREVLPSSDGSEQRGKRNNVSVAVRMVVACGWSINSQCAGQSAGHDALDSRRISVNLASSASKWPSRTGRLQGMMFCLISSMSLMRRRAGTKRQETGRHQLVQRSSGRRRRPSTAAIFWHLPPPSLSECERPRRPKTRRGVRGAVSAPLAPRLAAPCQWPPSPATEAWGIGHH